jgi:RNA polymerase sigma factor (sigma-70 family)
MFLKMKRNRGSDTKGPAPTDEAMIACYLQSWNKEIIGELFERYTHLVYGICLKYLGDHEQSRDAVMEIFENLFDKLAVHEVVNFRNWLYSVSRNHCLMILRKKAACKRAAEYLRTEPSCEPEVESAPAFASAGYPSFLAAAVESLSTDQSLCLRMMYYQDKSYKDISALTGFSLNQVKSHIQNGKRNLKNYLLGRYGYPSA